MDLRAYLRAIRKSWWLVLLIGVLGAGVGVLVNFRATPVYAARVTFYISTPSSNAATNPLSSGQFAEQRTNSYVQLLSSDELARLVVSRGNLPLTPEEVVAKISAQSQLNTVLVTATVKDTSAPRALAIARTVGDTFPGMVDGLDNRGTKTSTVALSVTSGPTLDSAPVSPRKKLNIALGLIAGVVLGLIAAVMRELLDTTVRSVETLKGASGNAVVGTISFDAAARKSPLIVGDQVRSVRAEAFRHIRTNLQFADVDHPPRVIVVTSSVAAEGKSTTAANLALVFAETTAKVLLIEADLRRPRVTQYLGIERAVGLTNVLAGQVEVEDVLQTWGSGLTVLPSGSIPPNPSELLGTQNMIDLVDGLRPRFDMIIIDTPPLLPVTDAAVVAAVADGVVVVVRYGKTTRVQLSNAIRSLESVDARVLGCVLNMRPARLSSAQGGYDGYGYYKDDQSAGPAVDWTPGRPGRPTPDRSAAAPWSRVPADAITRGPAAYEPVVAGSAVNAPVGPAAFQSCGRQSAAPADPSRRATATFGAAARGTGDASPDGEENASSGSDRRRRLRATTDRATAAVTANVHLAGHRRGSSSPD